MIVISRDCSIEGAMIGVPVRTVFARVQYRHKGENYAIRVLFTHNILLLMFIIWLPPELFSR